MAKKNLLIKKTKQDKDMERNIIILPPMRKEPVDMLMILAEETVGAENEISESPTPEPKRVCIEMEEQRKICKNRECSFIVSVKERGNRLYCSKKCQAREQNLRQGRIKTKKIVFVKSS